MTPESVEQFTRYGGYIGLLTLLIISAQATAIGFLWRRMGELQNQMNLLHERRVAEAKEVRQELMGQAEDFSQALSETSATVKGLKEALLAQERQR